MQLMKQDDDGAASSSGRVNDGAEVIKNEIAERSEGKSEFLYINECNENKLVGQITSDKHGGGGGILYLKR